MKKKKTEIDRLIEALKASSLVLQPDALELVRQFVANSQLPDGRFVDRGKRADWYYTFFGFLLCQAFEINSQLNLLKKNVLIQKKLEKHNLVDWAVWVLLYQTFRPSFYFKAKTSLRLISFWIRGRYQSDRVYLVFLSLLIMNHFWGWARCISGQIDRLTSSFLLNDHSPVSHLAAAVLIRHQAGLEVDGLISDLLQHTHPQGGFVAFKNHTSPDMLSTAVVTYALCRSEKLPKNFLSNGFDFISEQFDEGAFLSGDGDQTRDLEYTFYGLLGLSSYAQSLTKTNFN